MRYTNKHRYSHKGKGSDRQLKGSLTIEACIVLPFFLCFISLILFFAKFACVDMIIDHTVNETAKVLAASCYPISFINEYESDLVDKYGIEEIIKSKNFDKTEIKLNESNHLIKLLGLSDFDIGLDSLLSEASTIDREGISKYLVSNHSDDYWLLKNKAIYAIVLNTLNENLSANSLVNISDLRLKLVLFPQGQAEYSANKSYIEHEDFDLEADKDFTQNDIVIQTEFEINLSIPFVGTKQVKMIHTAVERAWLFGGNGVITSRDEGLDFLEEESVIVFITKTGIRYHISECRYLHSSKIPIKLSEATEEGYTPCKVCKPSSKE
jgi:hypothetical protein